MDRRAARPWVPRLKAANTRSPSSRAGRPVAALQPHEFAEAVRKSDKVVVDTRHMLAFGGGHVPGALNFAAADHLAIQAGRMLDPDKPLLLVVEKEVQVAAVVTELARTGFAEIAGYLAGGTTAWVDAVLDLQPLRQMHVRELAAVRDKDPGRIAVLDVRAPHEWSKGHVLDAMHVFRPELACHGGCATWHLEAYCGSGYRASIPASLLQAQGIDARNVPQQLAGLAGVRAAGRKACRGLSASDFHRENPIRYGHHIEIAGPFERALERVLAALKAEGFSVLSDIDIQLAMKEKLGKDMPAYRILGACNPPLADQALQADPEIGLLLPCNVTVRQAGDDRIAVGFLDPHTMVELTNKEAVRSVADDAVVRLQRVREALLRGD